MRVKITVTKILEDPPGTIDEIIQDAYSDPLGFFDYAEWDMCECNETSTRRGIKQNPKTMLDADSRRAVISI